MNTEKLKVETKGNVLVMKREFAAPRAKVFEAYSQCKHLKNWWGPRMWPLTECQMDFRVGGRWLYCMTGPDGTQAWGLAVYKNIQVPTLIAYDDYFSNAEGAINKDLPSSGLSFEFIEKDGKTIVVGTGTYVSPEALETVINMGMIPGMAETLDRLEEYLVGSW